MALPAFFWPPSGIAARGTACVPYGAGLAVSDWTTPTFYPFLPGVGFEAPVQLAPGTPGLSSIVSDGASGLFAQAYAGQWWRVSSSGVVSASGAFPAGSVYLGAAFAAGSGFALDSSGSVWVSGGVSPIGSWPVSASGVAISLTSSGTTLFALLPGSGMVGTMASTGGVTGSVALPGGLTTPSCLAASGGALAVGGWQTAPPLSGMACAAIDPMDATTMLAAGSGVAVLWRNTLPATENWQQTLILSGLANLNSLAWRPDGTQVLATSVASNEVQVIGYAAGVPSLAQTLSIAGACSVMVAGDSVDALVVQSGLGQVVPLSYAGTWSSGLAVSGLPGLTAIAAFGASGAVASVSGGVAFLGLAGGAWTVRQVVGLGFSPTVVTVDPFLNVYAAGSGMLGVLAGTTVIGSGAWSGGVPASIAVHQGRAIVAEGSALRVFGRVSPSGWVQESVVSPSIGAQVGLALSETVLFAMGSGATNTYGFSGTPFVLTPVTSGVAARYDGASWTTTALGIGHNPSSVALDASGNVRLVTVQNTWWNIASGGAVIGSGAVPVFPGQAPGTPLGCSAVTPFSGSIFITTSLAGVLIEMVP